MGWSNSLSRGHLIFPSSLSESRNSPSAGMSALSISHRWTMPSKRHAYPPRLIGNAQHDPLGTSALRGKDHESGRCLMRDAVDLDHITVPRDDRRRKIGRAHV